MDHRRTPTRRAVILPGWFVVGTVVVLLAAVVYLALALTGDDDRADVPVAPATPTASPSPTPSPSASPTPTPSPSPSPSPSPTPSPSPEPTPPARDVPVVVFNNTGRTGLAAQYAGQARAAGWQVTGVGNWRGSIPQSTVYHPAGQRAAAERLARDLGISRVRERVAPMRADRLTVVLSGTS